MQPFTPEAPAPTPAARRAGPVASLVGWVTTLPAAHVAGIAAVTTLVALGSVSSAVGVPLLAALVGVGVAGSSKG